MLPQYFDIHAHLNLPAFDDDRIEALKRAEAHSVWSIQVGTNQKSSQGATMIASFIEDGVFASIGVHPAESGDGRFSEHLFNELVKCSRVVAIGECGLDYSHFDGEKDIVAEKIRQKKLLETQIDFAVAHNLPLMLHIRDSDKLLADAHHDTLAILRQKKEVEGSRLRGNVHFFSQTIDIAREYFNLDFSISFTGVISFAREYDEVIRLAPIDSIMSETDCPYATPVPYRGKRNEPIFVEEVVKKIAEIRGEDFETVRKALVQNALRIFNIKPLKYRG
ncbi:MAG: TatD family hydrolase [Candidatus Yonathbacteria bacterium]|nr:TatD family hydrolase [Candidatus Yonathbacteria bacterium]